MTKHTIGDNRPAPEPYMISARNEHALSEVIGFILIIVIIITAFSLYLTYAVPAQGRDNEIKHMDEVKDEFTTYKTGVDALWTNGQIDTIISSTIRMGTEGATTQGSNGFLPIVQPVASGGTVTIGNSAHSAEWLKITSYSNIINQSSKTNSTPLTLTSAFQSQTYPDPPDNLIVNISVTSDLGSTGNAARMINISGTDQNGVGWQAQINLTKRQTFYQNYIVKTVACVPADSTNGTALLVRTPGSTTGCLVPMNQYNYTGTDLTLTVYKNKTQSVSGMILYNMIALNTYYNIDLLDPTYGLSSNIKGTPTITYLEYDPTSSVVATVTAQYAYRLLPNYQYNVSLGALEYQANNYYWIPQTYYYQLGGVFLSQSDGVSAKIPPSITFSYNKTGAVPLVGVNVVDIAYDQNSVGSISGTTPVQIGTKIKADSADLPYAPISRNTMNVTINFTSSSPTTNTNLMWEQIFKDAANRTGGIPNEMFVADATANGAYITINGFYNPPGSNADTPDINLRVKAVNLTASIQSISGV